METDTVGLGNISQRFLRWAGQDTGVRAVLLLGSRARGDSDEWSDWDFTIVVDDKTTYSSEIRWLDNCGTVLMSHTERTEVGGLFERRVVFEDGTTASFCVVGTEWLESAVREQDTLELLRKGVRILLDKDGTVGGVLSAVKPCSAQVCSETQFVNLVNRFWYEALSTAKWLRRGECEKGVIPFNGTMNTLCLRLKKWHRGPVGSKDSQFAECEREDAWRTLLDSIGVFDRLGCAVAERLGYECPDVSRVDGLIRKLWSHR